MPTSAAGGTGWRGGWGRPSERGVRARERRDVTRVRASCGLGPRPRAQQARPTAGGARADCSCRARTLCRELGKLVPARRVHHVLDGVEEARDIRDDVVHPREAKAAGRALGSRHGLVARQHTRARQRVCAGDEAQDCVAVSMEEYLGDDALRGALGRAWGRMRLRAVPHREVEGLPRVGDLHTHGEHRKAVRGDVALHGRGRERGGGDGGVDSVTGGGRRGKDEAYVSRLHDVRREPTVAGRDVRARDEVKAKCGCPARGRCLRVAAEELDVVEGAELEAIRQRVAAHKVVVAHELHHRPLRCGVTGARRGRSGLTAADAKHGGCGWSTPGAVLFSETKHGRSSTLCANRHAAASGQRRRLGRAARSAALTPFRRALWLRSRPRCTRADPW